MKSSRQNINIMSILIILPSFWFFTINDYVYYAASFCVAIALWLSRPELKVRIDPFLKWFIGFFVFVMILDLLSGGESLRMTATLVFVFSIIFYIVLVGINKKEIVLASFIGASTLYINFIVHNLKPSDHGNAAYLGAVVVVLTILKRYKIAILLFVASVILLTRSAVLATILVLFLWYILRIYKCQSAIFRRGVLLTLIAGLTIMPMMLARYFSDNIYVFYLTTGRSYVYSILWSDIVSRGIDIILPTSNIYSASLITNNFRTWAYQGSNIYSAAKALFYNATGCAHSTYLEYFINFGVIGFMIVFVRLALIETRTSWPVIAYFLIVIGFQCEVFTPSFVIPFYILYRSMYFHEENGFGFELNKLWASGKLSSKYSATIGTSHN